MISFAGAAPKPMPAEGALPGLDALDTTAPDQQPLRMLGPIENMMGDVPAEVRGDAVGGASGAAPGVGVAGTPAGTFAGTFKERKAEAERRILLEALVRNDWHLTRTARELGLADHASLSKMMKRHGLRQ